MTRRKKVDIKAHILALLKEKQEINLQDVAQASGLSKTDEADRKAISRMFSTLTKLGLLKAKGAARARTYSQASIQVVAEDHFNGIKLSKNSEELLKYIGRPTQARKPVGYNQDFLRSYLPNETFYLDATLRSQLLKFGRVEEQVQPAGTFARNILDRLLIELSWNSSRLEGNTYSMLETKRLIELGESACED